MACRMGRSRRSSVERSRSRGVAEASTTNVARVERSRSRGVAEASTTKVARLTQAVRVYLDHLTVERALAANTLSSYRRDLDRYVEALSDAELAEVTPARVAGFLAGLREGNAEHPPLSAASAARAVSAVRGLHRFAVREGLVGHDPANGIVPPTPPRPLPKALTVAEIEALLGSVSWDG